MKSGSVDGQWEAQAAIRQPSSALFSSIGAAYTNLILLNSSLILCLLSINIKFEAVR